MTYTKTPKKIRTTHRVRQVGSVWLWTGARRIEVRDIFKFADELLAAKAPENLEVKFPEQPCVAMSVEWTTEEDG